MRKLLLLGLLPLILSGCSNVAEWDRNYLAKPQMSMDQDPLLDGFREHIFFSREATSGGKGVGSGGCGCN